MSLSETIKNNSKLTREMISNSDSFPSVELAPSEYNYYNEIMNNVKLPKFVKYTLGGTLKQIIKGYFNTDKNRSVCLHHEVVEKILDVDPYFFVGVNIKTGGD